MASSFMVLQHGILEYVNADIFFIQHPLLVYYVCRVAIPCHRI